VVMLSEAKNLSVAQAFREILPSVQNDTESVQASVFVTQAYSYAPTTFAVHPRCGSVVVTEIFCLA